MQDEVTKHTRKIFKTLKNPNHTFGKKVKETLVEICIIVFAVTLSIWLHTWSEHRHEQQEAMDFLKGLKTDLNRDIRLLEKNREFITRVNLNCTFLAEIKATQPSSPTLDSAISHHTFFSMPVSHLNIGRYDGFKSSGKIETIENDDLKENILVFYQQMLPELGYSEGFINSLQQKILDLDIDKDDRTPLKSLVTSTKMKSLLQLGVHNSQVSINEYGGAIAQARKILAGINKYSD